jgi:hypothetical protein
VTLAGTVRHYQPLEMRDDARRPDQAVILGTDDTNGSTVLPIPVVATTAVVDAVVVSRGGPGPVTGTSIAITLTATPHAAGPGSSAQVGGAEPPGAQGPGAQWHAALWSAALVAAATLGKDLGDVTLSAVPAGAVDDAAAGPLLASGFVAAMTGARVDPAATVFGTLAPDGTIGPVAGLPERFLGAIARGKTRIGYPIGMRRAKSLATGQEIDLVELAKAHRAEAIELTDVTDAYALLTHRRLPAPVPLKEADMALDPSTRDRLDTGYLAWQSRLATGWAALLQLEQTGRLPVSVREMVRIAHGHSERAQTLRRAGKLAAAHGRMMAAWMYATGANQAHAVIGKLKAGDVDGAVATLTALDPGDARVRAMLEQIGAVQPKAIAGGLAVIEAFQAALRGWAYHGFAVDALAAAARLLGDLRGKPPAEVGSPATVEMVSGAVANAVLQMLRTSTEIEIAGQALARANEPDIAFTSSSPEVSRVAAALQAATDAGLRYLDARIVEPFARGAGISEDAARRQIAAVEPDYVIADGLSRRAGGDLPGELATSWGQGSISGTLLAFAGHAVAYRSAALVIAKYDAIGIHADEAGKLDAVDHPQAFRHLVANARRRARAAARAARIATGAIPVQAKLAYQLATAEATGSIDDQLDALANLWAATAFSEAAVVLARN